MNKEEILSCVKSLANSQGFYGRLYPELSENEELLEHLEAQKFNHVVELILFLES